MIKNPISHPISVDGTTKVSAMNCVAQIMSAWCTTNKCEVRDLPNHISLLYTTIFQHMVGSENNSNRIDVNKTVFPGYIICLEDGKKLKMLKRHLKSKYDLSLEDYRKKWDLPFDYPFVAPDYAEKRRCIAKDIKSNRKKKLARNDEQPQDSQPTN